MKIKNVVTLALLFVLSFSIVHEFVYAYVDDEHCSTAEYFAELEGPTNHGDICDTHYEYHTTYILPQIDTMYYSIEINKNEISKNDSYLFKTYLKIIKPPITS